MVQKRFRARLDFVSHMTAKAATYARYWGGDDHAKAINRAVGTPFAAVSPCSRGNREAAIRPHSSALPAQVLARPRYQSQPMFKFEPLFDIGGLALAAELLLPAFQIVFGHF